MNNVWTAITFRAPCAIPRQSRCKPLLQLFHGHARQQRTREYIWSAASTRRLSGPSTAPARRPGNYTTPGLAALRSFSSSICSRARVRPPKPPAYSARRQQQIDPQYDSSDLNLQPGPTVASHTEGLPEEEEELTWRDYDPEGGMPLPNGELNQAEINGAFNGEHVDADVGNYVLSVLHWRRLSGALIDVGLQFPETAGVTREMAYRGLQYLRITMPEVNETANGQVWAEEEAARLQQEYTDRAVKARLYRPDEDEVVEEEQGTEYGREMTGQSALQAIRAENIAKREREEARQKLKAEREQTAAVHAQRGPLELGGGVQREVTMTSTGAGGVTISGPQTKASLQPVERKPWVKYYEEQATVIKESTKLQPGLLKNTVPSFLVLLLTLGFSYYISENYTPPPTSARIWPDVPPSITTLGALTALLCTTFILGRAPPLWRTFNKYFTITPGYPHALSILGATVRHDTLSHLATNLLSLWIFGLALYDDVGRGTFLAIFFASGAVGGFTSLTYNVIRKQWATYIFGSSGAVLGITAASCTIRPERTLNVMGWEVPIAVWVLLVAFAGAEMFAAVRGLKTTIDHAGHLGGILAGMVAGRVLRVKEITDKRDDKDRTHDEDVD